MRRQWLSILHCLYAWVDLIPPSLCRFLFQLPAFLVGSGSGSGTGGGDA